MQNKINLIGNPTAGNHKLTKNWSDIEQQLDKLLIDSAMHLTTCRGDATVLTRRALHDGYDTIVVLGGDGTINEVVNGFFENGRQINSDACLGIISTGSGGDWIKTLNIPDNIEEAAACIVEHKLRRCDVGWLECQNAQGQTQSSYFINIADAGFGGTLATLANQSTKALGPFFAYLTGLLRTLAFYQNQRVRIQVDDTFEEELTVNSVVVANGQFFGGGMWIAPEAQIDDGLFEIAIVGDVNRAEVLANIYRIYNGTLAQHPKARYLKGKKITLQPAEESAILIEADGEQPGQLPATFEIVPKAINIIC
ncbi:MAG: diacylglycerol/lipid kinase family protein [bacterium]